MLRIWANFILWAAKIKIKVSPEDRTKLAQIEARILLSNHRSHLDSIVLFNVVPHYVTLSFAAKRELFEIPLYGKLLESSESVAIDRQDPKSAYTSLLKAFANRAVPRTLVVFAEGTRNTTSTKLLPFKRGPFIAAEEMQLPILPVLIKGSDVAMPIGKIFPRSRTIEVIVLEKINADELITAGHAKVKSSLWQNMKSVFASL